MYLGYVQAKLLFLIQIVRLRIQRFFFFLLEKHNSQIREKGMIVDDELTTLKNKRKHLRNKKNTFTQSFFSLQVLIYFCFKLLNFTNVYTLKIIFHFGIRCDIFSTSVQLNCMTNPHT